MGIYIKGMEMPTRCEDCFCFRRNAEYDYAYCNISSTNVLGHGNARLNNCPLIHVPKHGRLIDADALMRHKGDCYDAEGHLLYAVGTGNILCAPTIIPASEEDE
jgi:hypothetical protein